MMTITGLSLSGRGAADLREFALLTSYARKRGPSFSLPRSYQYPLKPVEVLDTEAAKCSQNKATTTLLDKIWPTIGVVVT